MAIEDFLQQLRQVNAPQPNLAGPGYKSLNTLAQQASAQTPSGAVASNALTDLAGTNANLTDAAFRQLSDLATPQTLAGGGGSIPPFPPAQLALGPGDTGGNFLPAVIGGGEEQAAKQGILSGLRGAINPRSLASGMAVAIPTAIGGGLTNAYAKAKEDEIGSGDATLFGHQISNKTAMGVTGAGLLAGNTLSNAYLGPAAPVAGLLGNPLSGGFHNSTLGHELGKDIQFETDNNTDKVDKGFIDNNLWDANPIAAKEVYNQFRTDYASAKDKSAKKTATQTALDNIDAIKNGTYKLSDDTREQLAQQQALQMLQPYLQRNNALNQATLDQFRQMNQGTPYADYANQVADAQEYNLALQNQQAQNNLLTDVMTRQAKVRYAKNGSNSLGSLSSVLAGQQAANALGQ